MKFCTITPTRGDRPQFLEFCRHQLSRMHIKPDHSYFIDHAPESTDFDLVGRVRKGVEQAKADGFERVFIIEDDDHYPADYFLHMPPDADFLGDDHTIYYHLGNRTWQEWSHPRRASLFTTGFNISALKDFQWLPDNERFLDISLWNYAMNTKKTVFWRQSKAIGIKHGIGLCGGKGHIQRNKYQDQDLAWLKAHVDQDAYTFYSTLKLK